ncbi:MAG TPA: trehalose-phosphatase [Usitatibacter sp.]|nr:trehalose-phosphatase [Usitatibacter sp.]
MRLLNVHADLDRFFHHVACAPERVLFLDYDGTLAPFHVDPARARPYPGVAQALAALSGSRGTRVVIVSARRIGDLRGMLAGIRHDEAWGAHGRERAAPRGPVTEFAPEEAATRQLALAEAPARQLAFGGARVERKPASVAMHWRGLAPPRAQLVRERLLHAWREIADASVELLPFDEGMEMRARGRDKGDAVREVLAGCSRETACAYLGDDFTDEDAFDALRGRGLAVLVRPELRETGADLWLKPPRELLAFLRRWAAAAKRGR